MGVRQMVVALLDPPAGWCWFRRAAHRHDSLRSEAAAAGAAIWEWKT
jgi:hypothetical protein